MGSRSRGRMQPVVEVFGSRVAAAGSGSGGGDGANGGTRQAMAIRKALGREAEGRAVKKNNSEERL